MAKAKFYENEKYIVFFLCFCAWSAVDTVQTDTEDALKKTAVRTFGAGASTATKPQKVDPKALDAVAKRLNTIIPEQVSVVRDAPKLEGLFVAPSTDIAVAKPKKVSSPSVSLLLPPPPPTVDAIARQVRAQSMASVPAAASSPTTVQPSLEQELRDALAAHVTVQFQVTTDSFFINNDIKRAGDLLYTYASKGKKYSFYLVEGNAEFLIVRCSELNSRFRIRLS